MGGFSQGAMLATDVVLRENRDFAGLVVLSGTLLAASEWTPLMPKRKGFSVLQSHGRSDPILPFLVAEKLRDALTSAGASVEFMPFNGGHGIPDGVVNRLGSFVSDVTNLKSTVRSET
jgi:phospholipase/carboxylesterase